MALVESFMDIPLGTPMPAFNLPDPDGRLHDGRRVAGSGGLLVVFTCNHCPYAIAVWPRLVALAHEAKKIGVHTVGINPNMNPAYPDDAPPEMKKKIKEWKIPFPYIIDESQQVARAFKAQCTPDPYLFDKDLKLVYHGRIDDNWRDAAAVKKRELMDAITALTRGKPVSHDQKPAMGCSIKWK